MAGEIVHIELPSSDFARSAAFYAKLFGWKTDGVQSGGHLLFELPGGVQGSWIRGALAQAAGPVPFVAVADVDKALDEAQKQGGRVLVRKAPLATRGSFGLLADCDGNVIGVLAVKGGGPERSAAAPTTSAAAAAAAAPAPGAAARKDPSPGAEGAGKGAKPPAARPTGSKPPSKISNKIAAPKSEKKPAGRKR